MASENTLTVYTNLQNSLKGVVAEEKALQASLTANDAVPQDELDTLDGIITTCEQMQAQVEGLVTHYNEPVTGSIPLIHGIEPDTGTILGGTPVIIDGHYFTGVTKLWFGDVPCVDFSVVNDDTIDATTPKTRISGPTTVFATNPAGTSLAEGDEVAATFTYSDPNLEADHQPVEPEEPAGFRGR